MIFILLLLCMLLLCIFVILLCYYYIIHYGRYGQLINRIPGKPTIPIFGNALQFSNNTSKEVMKIHNAMCKKYYPIYRFWIFTTAYVSVCHPDDIQVILNNTKHFEKGMLYSLLRPWLRTGLFTSTGAKWHKRRKMLVPTFHFDILKQFVNILVKESHRMTQFLNGIEGSIVEDLVLFISQHTLNAIYETFMSTSSENIDKCQQYRQTTHEMGKIAIDRLTRPWLYSDKIFALTSMGKKQAKNLEILHKFTEKAIAERKRYHELTEGRYLKEIENNVTIETDNDEIIKYKKRRLAMLDFLIAASRNNKINNLDMQEEIDTFMFGGYDTVAKTMCFLILLLGEHKNIQDLARKEINEVMQKNGGQLTMTALQNLPYLERCVKETLRLHPTIPVVMRVSTKDVKLQSYLVPSGTEILINIHNVHRNPNFWPNPEIFDPDRFLPENIQNRHPFAYLPFGAGPRICIGKQYALLELKIMIAILVHNFYLEPIDYLKDLRYKMGITKHITQPVRVKFVPIKPATLKISSLTEPLPTTEIQRRFLTCIQDRGFKESLKVAVNLNIRGTERILDLCRHMTNLISIIHVSTTYSNADRREIDESIYITDIKPYTVMDMGENLDDETIGIIKKRLIGNHPNTYTLTKGLASGLAEQIVVSKGSGLSIAIIRPSIICAAYQKNHFQAG